MPGLTYTQLLSLSPCEDERDSVIAFLGDAETWSGRVITAAEARAAGVSFNSILWAAVALAESKPEIERRLRHFAADCAARVLHIYEAERPGDDRPRRAIEATRLCADGQITDAAWAAENAARPAAWAAENAAMDAENAALDTIGPAAWYAWDAAWGVAWAVAADVAWGVAWNTIGEAIAGAARDAAGAVAADAENAALEAVWGAAREAQLEAIGNAAGAAADEAQYTLLCEWLSDTPPDPLPLPAKAEAVI